MKRFSRSDEEIMSVVSLLREILELPPELVTETLSFFGIVYDQKNSVDIVNGNFNLDGSYLAFDHGDHTTVIELSSLKEILLLGRFGTWSPIRPRELITSGSSGFAIWDLDPTSEKRVRMIANYDLQTPLSPHYERYPSFRFCWSTNGRYLLQIQLKFYLYTVRLWDLGERDCIEKWDDSYSPFWFQGKICTFRSTESGWSLMQRALIPTEGDWVIWHSFSPIDLSDEPIHAQVWKEEKIVVILPTREKFSLCLLSATPFESWTKCLLRQLSKLPFQRFALEFLPFDRLRCLAWNSSGSSLAMVQDNADGGFILSFYDLTHNRLIPYVLFERAPKNLSWSSRGDLLCTFDNEYLILQVYFPRKILHLPLLMDWGFWSRVRRTPWFKYQRKGLIEHRLENRSFDFGPFMDQNRDLCICRADAKINLPFVWKILLSMRGPNWNYELVEFLARAGYPFSNRRRIAPPKHCFPTSPRTVKDYLSGRDVGETARIRCGNRYITVELDERGILERYPSKTLFSSPSVSFGTDRSHPRPDL